MDSINTAKEGSSRVITQFLGHIVRGEPIKLVDGGTQKRTFTYIDDGIDALLKIIANDDGIASGKIYNIGNPANNFSVKELARMMLDLALTYPEYRDTAKDVELIETTADAYYGKGYQDVQNRVPKITNTCADLGWEPQGRHGGLAQAHLRCVSRPGRRSAAARRLTPAMILALKIDVDTLRGTREGVPNLVELLRRHERRRDVPVQRRPRPHRPRDQARISPGFISKVQRTSVVQHYGVKTLLYGTLLPGPDIGERGGDVMRHVRDEGFEVGIHCWDHTKWQDGVADGGRRSGPSGRCGSRASASPTFSRNRRARTAPPAGR